MKKKKIRRQKVNHWGQEVQAETLFLDCLAPKIKTIQPLQMLETFYAMSQHQNSIIKSTTVRTSKLIHHQWRFITTNICADKSSYMMKMWQSRMPCTYGHRMLKQTSTIGACFSSHHAGRNLLIIMGTLQKSTRTLPVLVQVM